MHGEISNECIGAGAAHVSLAGAESSGAMRWRKEGEKLRNDAIFPFRVVTNIA